MTWKKFRKADRRLKKNSLCIQFLKQELLFWLNYPMLSNSNPILLYRYNKIRLRLKIWKKVHLNNHQKRANSWIRMNKLIAALPMLPNSNSNNNNNNCSSNSSNNSSSHLEEWMLHKRSCKKKNLEWDLCLKIWP